MGHLNTYFAFQCVAHQIAIILLLLDPKSILDFVFVDFI